jgi:hypothetical protein
MRCPEGCGCRGRLPGEVWLPVAGYEGLYEVSNLGALRSRHSGEWVIVTGGTDPDGYPVAALYRDGKRKGIRLHRLVAEAFVPGRNILHREVAHLDNDRKNARADNLKWVSKRENRSHRKIHGTECQGERHPRAVLTDAQAAEIKGLLSRGRGQSAIARLFGVEPHVVRGIAGKRTYKHVAAPCITAGTLFLYLFALPAIFGGM